MKIPETPPDWAEILTGIISNKDKFIQVVQQVQADPVSRMYLHWDKLKRRRPPAGVSLEEWWACMRMQRQNRLNDLPLIDKNSRGFKFSVPEIIQKELYNIDLKTGGMIKMPEQITNPHTRDSYLVNSLIEEAITSSQLEGAATTRKVAKQMLKSGRKPTDTSEQMILNNYLTMQHIRDLKNDDLSPELVFEIHKLVTHDTLEDPTAAGRFRKPAEDINVSDDYGQIFHEPPDAKELDERLVKMCNFVNIDNNEPFIHPVIKAIILHFWLAYDHPFVDGNGRTARALFYWAMLRRNYWLFEYISISSIIRKAPVKYARSFLYTETDDNDMTYFLIAQIDVIRNAIDELYAYIERKASDLKELDAQVRALYQFNHRQAELIRHALKNPDQQYTFASHQKSHNIAYQTSRTDLLSLSEKGLLVKRMRGKQTIFVSHGNLAEVLKNIKEE